MSYVVLLDCGPLSGTKAEVRNKGDVIRAVDWPKKLVPPVVAQGVSQDCDPIPIIEYHLHHEVAHRNWKRGTPFLVYRPAVGYK